MGDDVVQIRSKDDEDINQFCLAENKTVTVNCSDISALLTIPELPVLPEINDACELTTEVITTELSTFMFTTEETGKVSVSSSQRTSTGAADLTANTLITDSVPPKDKPPPSTTVDGSSLTGTVTSSQQSTSNLDLLPSTTTVTPRNDFIATTPSSRLSGTGEGLSISLDGPYTSPTEPVQLEFITDVITEVETDLINLATPLPTEMFSEQERGLSNGPFREKETSTIAGVTFGPTTDKIENANAALIIGFSSLGVLFLIVAAVILFYKFYYKPKKSRRFHINPSLTITPTSGGSPQEVNGPKRYHDPDKRFLELHPANSIQAWDGKNETKEPYVKANDVDGKSPSALPPVATITQGGESDITKPKNKKKKRKRKTPEAHDLPNAESPVIGNKTGEPTEVIT
ncbi:hypothetical protein HOLleu_14980 [Holothuria leucospilota]|uniref:Uncharacterized protein n=1 Tax=Holothuria leucospilota TaxID=206669 RepID=A0A9Q1HCT7_HOLLE|nr:hypothetical protein HOLleu_14980 [Holothuria leucospilota]